MSNDKYATLVHSLHQMTKMGKIPWKPADQDDMFQASFKTDSVRIFQLKSNSSDDYYIYLINSGGDVVDSFSDIELDREFPSLDVNNSFYKIMGELYTMARRSALGADKVLDNILNQLSSS